MPLENAVNTFDGGLNKDVSPRFRKNNTYFDARDVSLSGDEDNFSLKPIAGSTLHDALDILESGYGDAKVLGSTSCNIYYKNPSTLEWTNEKGFVYIIRQKKTIPADGGKIKIYLHVPDAPDINFKQEKIYDEEYTLDISGEHQEMVGVFAYSEGGIDYIYFTDGERFLRKIPAKMESSVTYSDRETRLIPASITELYPSATIQFGGFLLYGAYDFYLRLVDSVDEKASDWSPSTDTIRITDADHSTQTISDGSIGSISSKKVKLSITISQEMLDNYDSIQYSVVERVFGISTYQTASLSSLYDISGEIAGNIFDIYITSNSNINTISVSDLIIDDASIESAKSISTKNNRLIAGGIKYKNLLSDNGTPGFVNNGVTIASLSSTNEIGYWRGEVYRYGIAYFNEDGAYGEVTPFDFSGVLGTVNFSSVGTDFKFPSRSDDHSWSILDSSTGTPRAIGLTISKVINHPTWAKGFTIVRTLRKKNIQFQTPLVPSTLVQPAQVLGNYPVLDSDSTAYSATPGDPSGTWMPKNFFRPWNYAIEQFASFGVRYNIFGSKQLRDQYIFSVFDPRHIYGLGDQYVFSSNDIANVVDIALLSNVNSVYSVGPTVTDGDNNAGNYKNTSAHGSFVAVSTDDYFVDDRKSGSPSFTFSGGGNNSSKLADYQTMENFGESVVMTKGDETTAVYPESSNRFGGYRELQPDGLTEGITPNNQKMSVIATEERMSDATLYCATTTAAGHYATYGFGATSSIKISDTYLTQSALLENRNDFELTATKTNAVSVVNIESGLGDDRYGAISEAYEYIPVKTINFSTSELTSVSAGAYVEVSTGQMFNGDCYITPHSFKISDGAYSVSDVAELNDGANETADDKERWGISFNKGSGLAIIDRAIALNAVSQSITLYLESDVDSLSLDRSVYNPSVASKTYEYPYGKGELKTPFIYNYPTDLSIFGDGKVFYPNKIEDTDNRNYPSRLIYSDQKIYQSFEEGFDRFRVLNTYDLEERNGDISNLHIFKDRLYCFQESGISYIPIDKQVVETADGIDMSLQSGAIIGTPLYLSTYYGSSTDTEVVSNDVSMFAIDKDKWAILSTNGESIKDISSNGIESFVRRKTYNSFCYDYSKKELIVYDRIGVNTDRPLVWSDKIGGWVSEYTKGAYDFMSLNWIDSTKNDGLYGITGSGSGDSNLAIYELYNGSSSGIFNTATTPYVSFTVNQDILNSKTFDGLAIYSTGGLSQATVWNNKYSSVTPLNVTDRENIYRVKTLRNTGDNARVRGEYANVKIEWNPATINNISHALMKYRTSKRVINKPRDAK